MQIILRRASALERACDQTIAELNNFYKILRISVTQLPTLSSDTVGSRLDAEETRALTRIAKIRELLMVKAEIRQIAGRKNDEVGINDLNRKIKALDTEEKLLSGIVSNLAFETASRHAEIYARGTGAIRSSHSVEEVKGALDTTQSRLQTVTNDSVPDYVEVPVLRENNVAALQERITIIRRQRTALQDERAALNLNNKIELSDSVVSVLRQHKLLDD